MKRMFALFACVSLMGCASMMKLPGKIEEYGTKTNATIERVSSLPIIETATVIAGIIRTGYDLYKEVCNIFKKDTTPELDPDTQ